MMHSMQHYKKFFWHSMNVSSWVTLTYPILTGHYSDRHVHLEANYCNLLQTMAFYNMYRDQLGETIYLT